MCFGMHVAVVVDPVVVVAKVVVLGNRIECGLESDLSSASM